jgi:rubredoxin
VYDPAEGDSQTQIEPGTPFLALPNHWRCPQCDSEPHAFIPIDE